VTSPFNQPPFNQSHSGPSQSYRQSQSDPIEQDLLGASSDPGGQGSPAARSPKRRIVAIALGCVLAALGTAYVVGLVVAGDRLPKHTTVEGVAVGGLDPTEAVDLLTKAIEPIATEAVPVTVAGEPDELDPADAGLTVDYQASIDAAGGGGSLDPRHIYRVLTGGSETPAVVRVDHDRLTAAVGDLADEHDRQPRNASLSYDGSAVVAQDSVPGMTVDTGTSASVLAEAYPTATAVPIPVTMAEPDITTAEVDALVGDFAKPAVSAPVVVKAGRAGSFRVTPSMIGSAISFEPADGTLAPKLDAEGLRQAVDSSIDDLDLADHRDATVRLVDGKPKVIPSTDGTDVSAADLAAAVKPALTKPRGERTVAVKLTGAPASFTTADAEKLRIREVTGEFTTYFPYSNYRNVNIGRAAQKINNTVLKPGQTFSLNKIVGERTKANGFVDGYIISGGKFKKELGGGVSQSATTAFNAMFFAGLQDVQHRPHTLYIDRYPAGREATVAWPTLDLKFRNNTDYGVLVQAYVKKATSSRKGSITVRMWSTKTWDKVTSTALKRSNFTTGRDITDNSSDCEPQAPVRGFTVNYSRLFHRDGSIVKREPFRWTYSPTDRIRCR
jgi:vancomycin resistance protein YoaR